MNSNLLKQYINKPSELNKESLAVLNELAEQFPYCQTIQVLVVKNLHTLNHFQYSLRLKLGAAYATDRKVLHALISNIKDDITMLPNQAKVYFSDNETPIITLVSPQEVANTNKTSIVDTINKKPNTSEEEKEFTTKPLTAAEIVAARLAEITEKKEPTISALKEPIIAELRKESEKVVIDEPNTTNAFEGINIPITNYQLSDLENTIKEENKETAPNIVEQKIIKDEEIIFNDDKNEIYSFSDWLKNKKNKTQTIVSVSENTQIVTKEENLVPQNQAAPYKDLIERFIETEPRIQPAKGTFYSPVNMARQSAIENDDIISETLAKIYYQQGNLLKALQMYEKLSLKYPEKIIFFAAQIETIKNNL